MTAVIGDESSTLRIQRSGDVRLNSRAGTFCWPRPSLELYIRPLGLPEELSLARAVATVARLLFCTSLLVCYEQVEGWVAT